MTIKIPLNETSSSTRCNLRVGLVKVPSIVCNRISIFRLLLYHGFAHQLPTLTFFSFYSLLSFSGIGIERLRSYSKFFISTIGYIGEFEIVDDHRGQKIVIELIGRLNKCGVISPRFDCEVGDIEKWIVNLLPSRQFGHVVLSTTFGIMTHEEARRKKTGGKILGFFY